MSFLELSNDYYWTAGRFSQEGNNRWEWASVEPFQPIGYSNWFPGEPSNSVPGSFAYMNYIFDNGVWFDEVSVSILFVCESVDEVVITTSTTSETTTTILDSSTTPEFTSTTERITTDHEKTELLQQWPLRWYNCKTTCSSREFQNYHLAQGNLS